MNKVQILVVEDDPPVRNLITTTLKSVGYGYSTVSKGEQAVHEIASGKPEIVLLDLGLPDIDGIEVIRRIRTWTNIPVIIISARNEDEDKIEALDAGADDYLTKPFSVDEMLARIRVVIRRIHDVESNSMSSSHYTNGELYIDYAAGFAQMEGKELHLTPIEYRILCLLAQNTGKVLTHKYITQKIWGAAWESNVASLRVFMATLRKKLEKDHDCGQFIQTHVGIGYRMLKQH